jgi:hypothetical protein
MNVVCIFLTICGTYVEMFGGLVVPSDPMFWEIVSPTTRRVICHVRE